MKDQRLRKTEPNVISQFDRLPGGHCDRLFLREMPDAVRTHNCSRLGLACMSSNATKSYKLG